MVRILSFVLRKCTKNKFIPLQSQSSVYSFALPSSLHSYSSLLSGGSESGKSASDSADDNGGGRAIVGVVVEDSDDEEEGMCFFFISLHYATCLVINIKDGVCIFEVYLQELIFQICSVVLFYLKYTNKMNKNCFRAHKIFVRLSIPFLLLCIIKNTIKGSIS